MGKRGRARPQSTRSRARRRPARVAWLFLGGGAQAAYQVGAVKALAGAGIVPDLLLGSAGGAINACLYATGGAGHMADVWTGYHSRRLFPRLSARENVLVGRSLFAPDDLYAAVEADIDFAAVFGSGTDVAFSLLNLSDGHTEIQGNRTLGSADALRTFSRASYTIPLLHPPVRIGDVQYVGALANGALVDFAIDWGATELFCIPTAPTAPLPAGSLRTLPQVGRRLGAIARSRLAGGALSPRRLHDLHNRGIDVTLLAPDEPLEGANWLQSLRVYPAKTERLIERGHDHATAILRRTRGTTRPTRKIVPLHAP